MSTSNIASTNWKLVEVGRVVLVGKKLATVVEIIDDKRALLDGPDFPRSAVHFNKVLLTSIVIEKLTRGARTGTVKKQWIAADVDNQWAKTSWAKKLAKRERRAQLTDFERFQVSVLKKQRNLAIHKAIAKA